MLSFQINTYAKGCFHSGWNGLSIGFPLILSARFSEMFLRDGIKYDYRVSTNLDVGITGLKASIDNYLVLSETYCQERSHAGGTGYWGANKTGYFNNSAISLSPSFMFLWFPRRHRDGPFVGAELGYLNLNSYMTLMTPWKITVGLYSRFWNGNEILGAISTGLSW